MAPQVTKVKIIYGDKSISEMQPTDYRNLCRDALEAVKRFYEKPENRAAYERWKQQKAEGESGVNLG